MGKDSGRTPLTWEFGGEMSRSNSKCVKAGQTQRSVSEFLVKQGKENVKGNFGRKKHHGPGCTLVSFGEMRFWLNHRPARIQESWEGENQAAPSVQTFLSLTASFTHPVFLLVCFSEVFFKSTPTRSGNLRVAHRPHRGSFGASLGFE